MNIPDEIWRLILSYLPLPYMLETSKHFYVLEKDTDQERYRHYTSKYKDIDEAIQDHDWEAVRLLLHYGYPISNRRDVAMAIMGYDMPRYRGMIGLLIDYMGCVLGKKITSLDMAYWIHGPNYKLLPLILRIKIRVILAVVILNS